MLVSTGQQRPPDRETLMKLRKLAKDPTSTSGACPSVYVAEEDPAVMVVQGKLLDAETTTQLEDLLVDETAVRVPAETVVRAVEKYLAER